MNGTWENGENLVLGPILGPKKFFHGFYLDYMLDIVASYHYMQFEGKLTNHTWENGKKPSFGTDFGPFGKKLGPNFFSCILPLLHDRHCCKLHAISKKINEPNLRKKPSFGPDFGPNLGHQFFFFPKKIWPRQLLDIMVSYHHVQYKKKKQWSNVEKTWRTDGQTDESDFRGCCPTNVEHPIKKLVAISYEFL